MNDSYGHQLPPAVNIEADDVIIISGATEGDRSKDANAVLFNDKDIIPDVNYTRDIGSAAKKFKDLFNRQTKSNLMVNNSVSTPEDGSVITFDLRESNIFTRTITQDCELSFINLEIGKWAIILTQDNVDGHTVGFEPGTHKVGDIGNVANQIDIVDVTCDGNRVFCNIINDFR